MVLSTLGAEEHISTRTVLLKDVSEGGFTFFTNYSSRKAQAMELNSQVTLLFPWYAMERQVSISGFAERFPKVNLPNTLHRVRGPAKSVHGQVRNHHHFHHAKNLNNALPVHLKNGRKEQPFQSHHIGALSRYADKH